MVGLGETPDLIGRQAELAEHRTKRLARIDGVEELLPHLDGQPFLRSTSSPRSLGVPACTPAVCAPAAAVPARRGAVARITHDRNGSGRSSLQLEQVRSAPPAGFISLAGVCELQSV
jgi:hypothetical protein